MDLYGATITDRRQVFGIVLGGFILIVIILLTLIGNTIVITAIASFQRLKEQHSNWFIVNLAIADIAVAVFVMILSFFALVTDTGSDGMITPNFGTILCRLQCGLNYCLIVTSMLTLGFISIDRLVHVLFPLHYHKMITKPLIYAMITWPWVQGIIIGVIPWALDWIRYDYNELVCAVNWHARDALSFVYVAFATCFMVPLLAIIICYGLIIWEIKKKLPSSANRDSVIATPRQVLTRLRSSQSLTPPTRASTSQHRRVIKSLLVVVVVFILCMTPFCVTKVLKVSGKPLPGWVSTVATFVQLSASACNPFIYGILRREFRIAFKKQYRRLMYKIGMNKAYASSMRMSADSTRLASARNRLVGWRQHSV